MKTRTIFVRGALGAALAATILVALLSRTLAFAWLESGSYDARVRGSARPDGDPSTVIIGVDNARFDALKDKLGPWPWTRAVRTETLPFLTPVTALSVAILLFFSVSASD